MKIQVKPNTVFFVFLSVYTLLGFINLTQLPVAWTDEVLNIDPAIQFHLNGNFTSKLWPNPGSDKVFASYLPLAHWTHTLTLYIFDFNIFNIRLPYLLMHCFTIWLLFNYLQQNIRNGNKWIPLLLTLVFALDKSVFEISRSVRIEVPTMLLISIYLSLQNKLNLQFLRISILGLLSMAHLFIWPLVFFWFLQELLRSHSITTKTISFGLILAPTILFLYQLDFNFKTLIEQLGMQTQDHRIVSTDLQHHPLINSFWYRFFPHYREQPIMWLVYMTLLILVPYLTIRYKLFRRIDNIQLIGFITLTLALFFIGSPQYRYLPPWLLLAFMLSSKIPQINWHYKYLMPILVIIAFNSFLSFGGRHLAACIQRPQRDATAVLNFIHKNIPQNQHKTLIWGESIGSYYCNGYVLKSKAKAQNQVFDYALDIYPQHWKNQNYDQVFLITHEDQPQLKLVAKYEVKPYFKLPNWAKSFAKGGTYDGTKIYRLAP